jgi:hypothetical protein
MKGTIKWLPFRSSFVLEKMCEIIRISMHNDKGFKEVHLTAIPRLSLSIVEPKWLLLGCTTT